MCVIFRNVSFCFKFAYTFAKRRSSRKNTHMGVGGVRNVGVLTKTTKTMTNNSFLTLVLLLLHATGSFSQDVIFKRDGNEIKAIVEEITLETLKYRQSENPDGPIITLANSELLFVKFKNGEKHMFTKSDGSGQEDDSKYKLGQKFGGGYIFFIDETGEHGLIAAPNDVGGPMRWGGAHRKMEATNYSDGRSNTEKIAAQYGDASAAGKCDALIIDGYDDWYLPAIEELELLYRNRSSVPSLDRIGKTRVRYDYCSSTEYTNANDCWGIHFGRRGSQFYYNKRADYSVRAIRRF